jgi:hypothetical protein
MITVRHRTALFSTILALTTAVIAVGAPASAAVPGFDVKITELPGSFAAGAGPRTVTAVASTEVALRCQKVRWSLLMQVAGVDLDQVKVDRIEDGGSFPLQVQANGDTARLTDVRLDPGELCRGSTVTARYQVSFAEGAATGRVSFQAEAYDRNERLLQQASAISEVVGSGAAQASPTAQESEPSPSPSAEPSADVEETGEAAADETAGPAPSRTDGVIASVPAGNDDVPSLLGPGLIIGAVLVFLGIALLLRLRLKNRTPDGPAMPSTSHRHR